MANFEDKFLVINKKYLGMIPPSIRPMLKEAMKRVPVNRYYVCNQDEPYAQGVIDVILRGEDEKNK